MSWEEIVALAVAEVADVVLLPETWAVTESKKPMDSRSWLKATRPGVARILNRY